MNKIKILKNTIKGVLIFALLIQARTTFAAKENDRKKSSIAKYKVKNNRNKHESDEDEKKYESDEDEKKEDELTQLYSAIIETRQ